MTHPNIFDMMYLKITAIHLFGSGKSTNFGTETHEMLCQFQKLYVSCQNSLMKYYTHLLQYSSMNLNASGGAPFNTASFTILLPLIARLEFPPVIG